VRNCLFANPRHGRAGKQEISTPPDHVKKLIAVNPAAAYKVQDSSPVELRDIVFYVVRGSRALLCEDLQRTAKQLLHS